MVNDTEPGSDTLSFERLVFFTDAVFAIAITLLALQIHLPAPPANSNPTDAELVNALGGVWPSLLSYLLGFVVLGIYWVNHHRIFRFIRRYDSTLIWLNLLLLLVISFMPFPTSILGTYSLKPLPAVLYSATVTLTSLLSTALWIYASRIGRLVDPNLSPIIIRAITIRGVVGTLGFLLSTAVAFFLPFVAMILWIVTIVASRIVTRIHRVRL